MFELRFNAEQRRLVSERAGHCCEYCRTPAAYSADSLSIEHIVPRSRGGLTDLENAAYSCQGCNNHKYVAIQGFDTVTGELVALFHPRLDRWADHFAWNEDGTIVLGITPVGRATIRQLQLNRPGLINLRCVLIAAGVQPT